LFLSKFDNKVDRKGRVSIPAPWRTALAGQSFAGVIVHPSPVNQGAVGSGMDRMERLSESIDTLNPYGDDFGALAATILTDSFQLPFDGDGRVILPQDILDHAGITEFATFAGFGKTFQIWQPEAFKTFREESKDLAREQARKLKLVDPSKNNG
jgi:MraZ protein